MTRTATLGLLAATLMSTSAFAGQQFQTKSFTFENEGATISGTLYLPDEYKAGDKLPTVLVTGAWTSVQDQMPKGYAIELAERGMAAVTFDFRGWGKSGDLPQNVRFEENPAAKISDIKAAFKHVATLPEVDAANLKGLGICASAGYMLDAATGNELVQSVALVAPWLQNREIVNTVYGGDEGVAGLIKVAADAKAKGGEIIPAAGPEGATGVLMPIGGYYYEKDRGAIAAYDNKWNNTSWEHWLTYFPVDNAGKLDKPLKIVHSEAAAIPQGVKAYTAGMKSPAEVKWLDNVTQFDFYDQEKPMNEAADAVVKHFNANIES
jgi:uncharacterized protein